MRRHHVSIACSTLLLLAAFQGTVNAAEGKVRSSSGTAIERVQIEVGRPDRLIYSDTRGAFTVPDAWLPASVRFSHPRFEDLEILVAPRETDVLAVMEPRQAAFETLVVSARRGEESVGPVSLAGSVLSPSDRVAPPRDLTEMVVMLPGVQENGQGGLFQTPSIRGVARQRVLTLVSGMRIVGDRRAGVSASFIDPLLLDSVDVIRGPSSVDYGSGGLGGLVQVFPRRPAGVSLDAFVESQGNEAALAAGWGNTSTSIAVARRGAGDAEAPDGLPVYSRFEQLSGVVSHRWVGLGLNWELLAIPTWGEEIGKPNTDYPDRITTYPEERHLLVKLALRDPEVWRGEVWVHRNRLQTEVVRPERSRDEVLNEAMDFGFLVQRRFRESPIPLRVGLEGFGRRGVDALERNVDLRDPQAPVTETRTLWDGFEDEIGVFADAEWVLGAATLTTGGRGTWQHQGNTGVPDRKDASWAAFVGLVRPLPHGLELVANLASGLRFPSLTERFYTGTTGRGSVQGNADLDPERSLDADLGMRWFAPRAHVAAYAFRKRVTDFIERTEVEPDLFRYENRVSARIVGAEMEGSVKATRRWTFLWGGHRIRGRDDTGAPLSDVPANRITAGVEGQSAGWKWRLGYEYRFKKTDTGEGESPLACARPVSASLRWMVRPDFELSLFGSNLLDDSYRNAADAKTTVSPGWSVGFGVSWRRPA